MGRKETMLVKKKSLLNFPKKQIAVFDIKERKMSMDELVDEKKKQGEKLMASKEVDAMGKKIAEIVTEINKFESVEERYTIFLTMLQTLIDKTHIPVYLKDYAFKEVEQISGMPDVMELASILGEKILGGDKKIGGYVG